MNKTITQKRSVTQTILPATLKTITSGKAKGDSGDSSVAGKLAGVDETRTLTDNVDSDAEFDIPVSIEAVVSLALVLSLTVRGGVVDDKGVVVVVIVSRVGEGVIVMVAIAIVVESR